MFKIHRKITYALVALKHLSRKAPGQLTKAKELSELYQIPFDPTARVLQIMAQHKILKAEQGVKGGYLILKDLSKVTIGNLIEILIGPLKAASCLHEDLTTCENTLNCSITRPIINLNQRIIDLMQTTKVADLIDIEHHYEKTITCKHNG